MATNIEWTDETWNPTTGCTKISPGCAHCYIDRTPPFRMEGRKFEKGRIPLRIHADRLDKPLHWRKPRRVFVNSLSDLFHEDVPFEFIDRVFGVMAKAYWHTFQVLTKRPERAAEYLNDLRGPGNVITRTNTAAQSFEWPGWAMDDVNRGGGWNGWPYSNVWLGTSVEDQKRANERIPHLLRSPAAVRFLSAEPLLGPVDLDAIWPGGMPCPGAGPYAAGIDWVIVGGESGPGARPCNPQWVRGIVNQCREAGVPAFVKQMGSNVVTRNDMVEDEFNNGQSGWPDPDVEYDIHGFREDHQGADCRIQLRDKKGGDWLEWPDDLRVRQFPPALTVNRAI